MQDFEFRTVPRIFVAWGAAARLGELAAPLAPGGRTLVVTDPGLVRAGLVEPALASLREAGLTVEVFDAIVSDPPEEVAEAAAARARDGIGLVVGLGGGSSMDVAKLAAVMAAGTQTLREMFGVCKVTGGRLPLVLVPTTAGTGSEVTNISVISTEGGTVKLGVNSPQLYADLAVLDASLTLGLPASVTAATGIDAMVHAIEAYTTRTRKNPVSDALAREALRLLGGNLVRACRDGGDRGAREAMLLGSMLAGQAFSNAPVAAVHALAYPVAGHYHVTHGLSNALMLGPVLRFNARAVAPMFAELADVVAGPGEGNALARSESFVAAMERLMDESGAPRRLRDVGVTDNALSLMASEAMKQQRLLVNNPVVITEEDALALYREAF